MACQAGPEGNQGRIREQGEQQHQYPDGGARSTRQSSVRSTFATRGSSAGLDQSKPKMNVPTASSRERKRAHKQRAPVEKSSPYPLKSIRSVLRSNPQAKGFSELKFPASLHDTTTSTATIPLRQSDMRCQGSCVLPAGPVHIRGDKTKRDSRMLCGPF
ncbi:hypothetical protein Q8A67_013643 [Cirrhinus molitorella]|uniref:Uncharacterized protein n=1 Tax=Cirrhinus molitorella TaxID=172907 RepID=A0AA88PIP4_9TELE|nr:hypothetical protein Q8A67_013643 [Cirrhinus molitorella]